MQSQKDHPIAARTAWIRTVGVLITLLATAWFAPPAYAATGTCSAATGQGSNGPADYSTYCWIDFTNYDATQATSASGQAFTITTPNGGTFSFTLKVSSNSVTAATVPTWSGAAFGQTAFTGVPGKPSIYQTTNGATTTVTLSNIVLTVGSGSVPYAIVAADAESTNNGESLSFTTNGNAWTLLSTMPNGSSTTYPTLTGVGTTTVNEAGVAGTVGAYAFATQGSPTTISSTMVGSGLQGIAFGLKFHAADLVITKSHSGNFTTGTTGSYTLTVKNNGPDDYAASNTITVTDTLPTGLTYSSATGSGWSCGAAGQVVTCTTGVTLTSGSTLPVITVTVNVTSAAANAVTNSATVAVLNGYDYNSSNNTANDATTVLYATDVQITNTHSGNFSAGANASYTLTVTNNGPLAANGTTTVSDTLPTGETFVSGTGTGWSCSAVGQVVTCTSTTVIASGTSLPSITLAVLMSQSAPTSVSTTATVSNSYVSDTNSANNSSTDTATVTRPNYSTSTKTWVDLNGGDVAPGDTVEYTITVKDTGNAIGNNIEVTDNIPANVTSFSLVSIPSGSTNASTGTGTGSNGTGYLDITGISVPANGSVTVVFDVVLSGSLTTGSTVNNSATVVGGTATATPAASTITINQSLIPASGNKVLYVYSNQTLTRTPQTATGTIVMNGNNTNTDFTLSPALQKNLVLSAGTISVQLVLARSGSTTNTSRTITASLRTGAGTALTNTASQTFTSTTNTVYTFNLTVASTTTVTSGNTLVLRLNNNSGNTTNRTVTLSQWISSATYSRFTFTTTTVINVDSVNVYSAAYSSTSTPTNNIFEPNFQYTYIRAVVSDPFGSYDIDPATGGTAPKLTLTDSNGVVQLNAVNMTQVADSGAATKTFEYYVSGTNGYTVPNSAAEGFWTPSVTATEGTETSPAVTHTANGSFEVRRPSLLIAKFVALQSDPIEGSTRPKNIPGAVEQYTIQVSNNGKGRANAIVITDAVPTNTSFVVGSITFTDGSPSSGLAAPTVSYDNTSCAGTFSAGSSSSAKCIKFAWTTADFMNGKTTTAPNFSIRFNVTVN